MLYYLGIDKYLRALEIPLKENQQIICTPKMKGFRVMMLVCTEPLKCDWSAGTQSSNAIFCVHGRESGPGESLVHLRKSRTSWKFF